MPSDPQVFLRKLHLILHRSLVESRNLALRQDCQQLFDLADTFENIPLLLNEWDPKQLETVRAGLQSYQAKYQGIAYDYLSILDMDEREFQEVFGRLG